MSEPAPDRVVVKVGGSLFTRADLPRSLNKVRHRVEAVARSSQRIWIAGGGAAVEALREIDAANPLPETVAHRAAIQIMEENAKPLSAWLPGASLTRDWERLARTTSGEWVFAPGRFLEAVEPGLPGAPLPIGWGVTSDSIAARVAECLGARLVLLKSRAPGDAGLAQGENLWADAAARGYVDEHFPRAAAALGPTRIFVMEPPRPGDPI